MSLPSLDFEETRNHPFNHLPNRSKPFAAVHDEEPKLMWQRLCIVLSHEVEAVRWGFNRLTKDVVAADKDYRNMVKAEHLLVEVNKALPVGSPLAELKGETSAQFHEKWLAISEMQKKTEAYMYQMTDLLQWVKGEKELCDAFYAVVAAYKEKKISEGEYLAAVLHCGADRLNVWLDYSSN